MTEKNAIRQQLDRKSYIGGSDARTIMGADEANLLRLWREKRGELSRRTCPVT